MAVLAGIIVAGAIQAQQTVSSDLGQGSASFGTGVAPVAALTGALAAPGALAAQPQAALSGTEAPATHLWDRVVLVPNSKALGLVGSEQTFGVEVWNTFRSTQWSITAAAVSGVGGLQLSGVTLPAQLSPTGSRVFTATVPELGSATIANSATFSVAQDRAGGAVQFSPVLTVTGLRITPFPFAPDWSRSVRERIEYKTSKTVSRTGAEQRARLRLNPRRGLEFDLTLLDPLQVEACDALLWDRQADLFAVPWWPDQVRHSGTLAAGATTIAIDTTNRLFSLASMVMIWSSWDACEVQTVESVSDGLVTCSALAATYTNPIILPAFPGRLPASLDRERSTARMSKGGVKFSCEVGTSDPRPSPSTPAQAYGYDVLEVMPNWENPRQNSRRMLSVFDNEMAAPVVRDRGLVSFQSQGFRWFLNGRAQAKAFRDFVDRRVGSLVPFWVPTWRQDLTVAQLAASTDSGIVVKACGYTTRMFPDRARRYLAIRNGQAWIYRKVTAASATSTTETLTLDAQLGATIAAGTIVSFLILCRMDDDDAAIDWQTTLFAESTTSFTELPKEVPA